MLFNLHSDYVKAAAPRVQPRHVVQARAHRAEPPPGRLRSRTAQALAGAARRLDGDTARRVVA
jgi:hypothetical protein